MAEGSFVSDDGTRIAYVEWPEGPPDALPAVIVHHGFLADARSNWERPGIVAALVGAGRRVVGVDARGHGRSDKPHQAARYGYERMAADVSLLADHLGLASFDLVGYSMGATVSMWVASGDRRLRRLALGGIGARVLERTRGDAALLVLADGLLADDPESIADPVTRRFRAFAEATGNDLAAVAAQARASADMAPLMPGRVQVPTLVFAGDTDPLAERPEVLARALQGARLEILSGDHLRVLGDPRLGPLLVEHLGS